MQVPIGPSPLMEAVTATLDGDFRPSMGGLPLGSPDVARRDVIVTKLRNAAKAQGVEGYVRVLEQAYGDEALGNEVRDRMAEDRQFSIGIRGAMTSAEHTDRLRAAIDSSPYMQAAAQEATRRRADGDAVQAVMGDDTIQGQIAEMTANPEVLRQTQEQSEALLKRVCGELVEGVREYREDFEPDADALIEKFADIQSNGYEAFVKYSLSDVKVKNAVINALYDEMEEAQKDAARRIEADAAAEE